MSGSGFLDQPLLQLRLHAAEDRKGAEDTARPTVNSGTSEIVVVKVRLLAVMPSRSSGSVKAQRLRHRQPGKTAWPLQPGGPPEVDEMRGGWRARAQTVGFIAGIMPSLDDPPDEKTRPTHARRAPPASSFLDSCRAAGATPPSPITLALIALGLAWELWPRRCARAALVAIKVLPLCLPLPGLLKTACTPTAR